MPKEFFYGSNKRIPGYGIILASENATSEERNWISQNSIYTRIGNKDESPLSYSFTLVGQGGFLSRILPGIDYSGRVCSMANHLELSQEEMLLYEDGPVYVLDRYRFVLPNANQKMLATNERQFMNRFDGRREENVRCNTWQCLLGLLGQNGRRMAGAVASLITQGQKVFLIYEKEQRDQILALFREVWTLLPASLRWRYSFNTYLSNLGTTYSFNGILKDSEPFFKLQGIPGSYWIDLSTGECHLPADVLEVQTRQGLDRYLLTGDVAEAPQTYGIIPDFPTPASDIWESQNDLLDQLQYQLEEIHAERAFEVKRLNAELVSLKETSQKYKNNADRMKNELAKLQENIETKTAALETLQTYIQQGNETLAKLKEKIKSGVKEQRDLSNMNHSLKEKADQFNSDITKLRETFSTLKQTIHDLESTKKEHDETIKELSGQIEKRRNEVNERQNEVNGLQEQIENLQNEVNGLEKQVSSRTKDKKTLETEIEQLKIFVSKENLSQKIKNVKDFCATIEENLKSLSSARQTS